MKFKNGDLVIDYEGDLTLMVANSQNSELLPITLSGDSVDTRPYYYNSFLTTGQKFHDYHRKHNYKYHIVGNLSDALKNLHVEIPK